MGNRFSVETIFKGIDRVSAPVRRIQNRVGKMTRSMDRGFHQASRSVDNFGKKAKRVALGIVASMAIASVAIAGTINTGAEFGRAIGSSAAKFPEQIQRGTKEFKELELAARRVGSATEYTSTQAAKGLNFLAKAGYSAKFAIEALPDIVDFATASEIEFAEAADIASDALGAFGLDSEDAGKKLIGLRRVMDVMAKTANSTNVSVLELFESIKMGASLSDSAGSNIETFSAIMGYLAGNGIKAMVAGTASKNITLALAGIGNQAEDTFRRLGIKLADSEGKMRDQLDVLDDLRKSLSKFGEKQKLAIIEAIFGKIPIASASKLMKDTTGRVRELRKEFYEATGYNKKAAAFIRDDVKGSLDSLKSAIEGVSISIFSMNEGPLKAAIDRTVEWVRANEAMIATNIGGFFVSILSNIDSVVDKAMTFGPVIGVFIALSAALKTLAAIMTIVNLALAMSPIGWIVVAITALTAAVAATIYWWDELKAYFLELPTWGKWLFALLTPIGSIIAAVSLLTKHWGYLSDKATEAWAAIKGPFQDLKFGAQNLWNKFAGVFGHGSVMEDQDGQPGSQPSVVSPQERLARSIEERSSVNKSEVTIKDETGRAHATGGKLGPGLTLVQTGAF